MPLLRCLQTLTAAAALFALLGACGLGPAGPARPARRPRPVRAPITIRSLTGTWSATIHTADGRMPLTLSIVQSGDILTAHLTCGEGTWATRPSPTARIDAAGGFVLVFGSSPEILLRGRAADSGTYISAWVEGLRPGPALVDFFRQ